MAFGLGNILGILGGGGIGGALTGMGTKGVGKFLLGDPEREKQFQRFTPEQQASLDQLLQQGMEAGTGGIEDLARKRFQEETIPSIAERFTI